MKTILSTFIFFLCLAPLVGQTNDSIRQEILGQPSSKLEILSKGRRLLLENLQKGDLFKVMEIKDALISEADNNVNEVFFPGEYSLILYWTEEYPDLLAYIKSDAGNVENFRSERMLDMLASTDQLYKNISIKSAESYDVIIHFLDEAQLSDVEKDFLELHLYWMLFGPNRVTEQEALAELNDRADAFLQKYPNSEFDQYVRRNIRFKLALDDWGIGYEIAMGYAGMQGNMANQFKDGFLFRLTVDGSYKKTILSLNLNMGGSSTLVNFPFRDTEWPKGSHALMAGIDITAGYRALEVKRFSLTPFAGFGAINFGAGAEEIEEDIIFKKLNFTSQNYLAGVNCTFDLSSKNSPFSIGGSFINLRYTFSMPQYNGRKGIESGNMHWLTLGWGMYGRPYKRVF